MTRAKNGQRHWRMRQKIENILRENGKMTIREILDYLFDMKRDQKWKASHIPSMQQMCNIMSKDLRFVKVGKGNFKINGHRRSAPYWDVKE
jgi:hypothetical protein